MDKETEKLKSIISILKAINPSSFPIENIDHLSKRIREVCKLWKIRPEDISKTEGRKLKIVEARQVVMFLLKYETSLNLSEIGEHLGNKGHATVLHSIKKVNELAQTDRYYMSGLMALELDKYLTNHKLI